MKTPFSLIIQSNREIAGYKEHGRPRAISLLVSSSFLLKEKWPALQEKIYLWNNI